MNLASNYFSEVDANSRLGLSSAEDLWEWVEAGATDGLTKDSWLLSGGDDTYFRGQASTAFGLSSKLYRDCKASATAAGIPNITEADLARAERDVLDAMGFEGIGRRMSEGEMLMVLQHHGVATRLMDVSGTPKEALFFACDKHDEQDGRLFIFTLPHPEGEEFDCIELGEAETLPWLNVAVGTRYAISEWTGRVAVVVDDALDPRMRAQNGRFLVGGLARRYAGKGRRINGKNVPASSHPEISTLDVNFLKVRTTSHNNAWGASGWTVRIDASWKPWLRSRLAAEPEAITTDTMYPPVNEVARLARRRVHDFFAKNS